MNLPFELSLTTVGLLVLVLAIFLATARVKKSGTRGALSYPYAAAESLFTPHERAFLRVLEEAAGAYRVYGKVRVADVIEIRKGLSKGERQRALNRTSQKHLDFVLCNPHDLSIFCAVELDDASHRRADRRARDAFLEAALSAAQVPLVRVAAARRYDPAELEARFRALAVPTQGR
jgi:hypothetical protein